MTAGNTRTTFPNFAASGGRNAVGVDMDDPFIYMPGLQDHDSWKGPVNGRWVQDHGLTTGSRFGPGDGIDNVIDPTDSRWVLQHLHSASSISSGRWIINWAFERHSGRLCPQVRGCCEQLDRAIACRHSIRHYLCGRTNPLSVSRSRRFVGK